MSRFRSYQFVLLSLLAFSCSDAGVGFNLSRKVPIVFEIYVPGNDLGVEPVTPSFTETFRLSDVKAFKNVLEDLAENDAVTINFVSYTITEVDSDEEIAIDAINLTVVSIAEQKDNVLAITGSLKNTPEGDAGVKAADKTVISNILTTYKEVDNTLTFDFPEIPDTDLNFIFTLYYDVTLRVRY